MAAVRVSTGDIKQVEVRVIYSGYKLDKDLMVSATQSGDSVEVEAKTTDGDGSIPSLGPFLRQLECEFAGGSAHAEGRGFDGD